MTVPSPRSPLSTWVLAARPRTLVASTAPVFLGTACAYADGRWVLPRAVVTLLASMLIQVGTNLANDLYDFLQGADTDKRQGPLRVTQAGLLSPFAVRLGMVAVFSLAMALGLYLVAVAGPAILVIGIASIVAAWGYTARPLALGYRGLGDPLVFLFFGPVAVCGTYFVQAGIVSTQAIQASVVAGALATAILVVNNLRDMGSDREAGKHTLAVRMGRNATLHEYGVLILLAYAFVGWIARERPFVLLGWLSLPLALLTWRALGRAQEPTEFHRCLGRTAMLQGITTLLLSIGIVL